MMNLVVLAALWLPCRALVVHRGAPSRALPLRATFFDTEGRLERTGAPPDAALGREPPLYVPIHDGLVAVRPDGDDADGTLAPAFLSAAEAAPFLAEPESVAAWLGSMPCGGGERRPARDFWLLELSHREAAPALGAAGARWAPLRGKAGGGGAQAVLGARSRMRRDDDVALVASARALGLWHRSVRFCAACGGATAPHRAGRNRKCGACGARYRPRVDPSIIVLVARGDECLLGRQASWPAGRYSTLAGFVELGETFEEAVVREVREEAGVTCDRSTLRFVASQPWLFPRSLMVGFVVETADTALEVDESELEDARWFSRAHVLEHLARQGDSDAPATPGEFHVPSGISLARKLIEAWALGPGAEKPAAPAPPADPVVSEKEEAPKASRMEFPPRFSSADNMREGAPLREVGYMGARSGSGFRGPGGAPTEPTEPIVK